jgi:hypothetical protein
LCRAGPISQTLLVIEREICLHLFLNDFGG